ncbi:MAG: cytochrome P450 [Myxococcales bacterium]|nr:cytochrome P450 [Myxococcales bacterium]
MTAIDELDNWLSPAMLADPYAIYQQLRERDPVHWNPQTHAWVLTRHADVAAALQDRRLSSVPTAGPRFSRPLHPDEYASIGAVVPYLMMFMQGMDPPLHTRQRALVHRTFTPRTIERLRPRTEALVAAALDRASTTGTIELMAELASPLPATIIMEMLGIPLAGQPLVRAAAATIAEFLSLVDPAEGQLAAIAARLADFAAYLAPQIAQRREHPQDDLLSALVTVELDGERLGEPELLVLTTMLLFAGHETTTNLIGNGAWTLATRPDQWQLLQANPALVAPAVEEMLRHDTSVQFVPRWVREPLELGGKQLEPGQRVLLNFAAANRDPALVPDPDRFDLTRPPSRHLAFGQGPHHCLGVALARLEAQVVFTALVARAPRLSLDPAHPPTRKPSVVLRGPAQLHLRLT